MNTLLALALAFASGFLSLSQEILWIRAMGYQSGGHPAVFAYVLAAFLLGVALGSWQGRRLTERMADQTRALGLLLVGASLAFYLAFAAVGWLSLVAGQLAYLLVIGVAAFSGAIFPILCHGAIPGQSDEGSQGVGSHLSRIYFFNILGSTLGSILTGFVLLDKLGLDQAARVTVWEGLALAALVLGANQWRKAKAPNPASPAKDPAALWGWAALAAALLMTGPLHGPLYKDYLEKLHFKMDYGHHGPYKYLVENRSGIIAVSPNKGIDMIYGGGMYDGGFNLEPDGPNSINKGYYVANLMAAPKRILEIGLASGSWARVLADRRDLERMVMIEINPGYVEVIHHYPEVATLLDDPRVELVVDDGRRWLHRHGEKFDLILMNTTFHWRQSVTNLLSKEFLELAKSHLNPGGVLYFNSTDSPDVMRTAATVFAHVANYRGFVAASDQPFNLGRDERKASFMQFYRTDRPTFDPKGPYGPVLEKLLDAAPQDVAAEYRNREDLYVISDDNMATEFKNHNFFNPKRTWASAFEKPPLPH